MNERKLGRLVRLSPGMTARELGQELRETVEVAIREDRDPVEEVVAVLDDALVFDGILGAVIEALDGILLEHLAEAIAESIAAALGQR